MAFFRAVVRIGLSDFRPTLLQSKLRARKVDTSLGHLGACRRFSNQTDSSGKEAPTNVSGRERLRVLIKEYGPVVVVFHITLSIASLGLFYLAVDYGLDVPALLAKCGLNLQSSVSKGASTFAVAYVCHKALAPVRIGITLAATPLLVACFRRIGLMKGLKGVKQASQSGPPKP